MANTNERRVDIISPDGTPGDIPESQLQDAIAAGYTQPKPTPPSTVTASPAQGISANNPSLMQRVKSSVFSPPAYNGTLDSPGTSTADKFKDVGEGAVAGLAGGGALATGMAADAAFPTATPWLLRAVKTIGLMKLYQAVGDQLGIPYASLLALRNGGDKTTGGQPAQGSPDGSNSPNPYMPTLRVPENGPNIPRTFPSVRGPGNPEGPDQLTPLAQSGERGAIDEYQRRGGRAIYLPNYIGKK